MQFTVFGLRWTSFAFSLCTSSCLISSSRFRPSCGTRYFLRIIFLLAMVLGFCRFATANSWTNRVSNSASVGTSFGFVPP